MKVLVAGCAGFIGSHTTEALLERGYRVVGIDSFNDYYSASQKESNIKGFASNENFRLIRKELNLVEPGDIEKGIDFAVNLAGRGGVRKSWDDFGSYVRDNVLATQRLLELFKDSGIKKFVHASSSSVYGDSELPFRESGGTAPMSPYGITKLAAEKLCSSYEKGYGIPTVALRYFTVYGPRQRPDMAFNIFIKSILEGKPIRVFGSGEQTRDFTFVSDIVSANIAAMESSAGGVFNIGGGGRISLNGAIELLERLTGRKVIAERTDAQRGDVAHTGADLGRAREQLGYKPGVGIEEGLKREIEWMKSQRGVS